MVATYSFHHYKRPRLYYRRTFGLVDGGGNIWNFPIYCAGLAGLQLNREKVTSVLVDKQHLGEWKLMDENNEELIERMREKCRQQRWHGPDMHNPFPIVEQMRQQRAREQERFASLPPGVPRFRSWSAMYWHDRNGKHYEMSADTDLSHFPLQRDFGMLLPPKKN